MKSLTENTAEVLYPMKLQAVLKDTIWGGTALSERYGKGTPGKRIAEAWSLACREDGENIIENGVYAGKPLGALYDVLSFPLLVKLIDARDKLSVQVHPDDTAAREAGFSNGKTEMWYVLEASPDAQLVYGLSGTPDSDTLRRAARDGTLESYLRFVHVKKGDVFFIPAGLVHAIGSGILVAEVQQNSNTTYRLYDYNRVDRNGNRRALHLEEALRVIDKSPSVSPAAGTENNKKAIISSGGVCETLLCRCPYFSVRSLKLSGARHSVVSENEKMRFALCVDGKGFFRCGGVSYEFSKGDGYLLPAGIKDVEALSDGCELLLASE